MIAVKESAYDIISDSNKEEYDDDEEE